MNRKNVAKLVGISRQQIDFAISGKRNLSLRSARKIAEIIGGPFLCWIDPDQVATRRQVWADFVARDKRAEK